MFLYKVPFTGNLVGNIKNDIKLASDSTAVEAGSFMIAGLEDGEGVAKLGSTKSTDQFLGIAMTNNIGTQVPVIFSGVIPEDKTVTLPSIPVAGTELVRINGTASVLDSDYTIEGTTLTFVTGNAGDTFDIVYKREVSVAELEGLGYNCFYPQGVSDNLGSIDIALSGEFTTTCFDSTADFESSLALKIDSKGCLTTKGDGVDVSDRVFIMKLPDEDNGCMVIRLIG